MLYDHVSSEQRKKEGTAYITTRLRIHRQQLPARKDSFCPPSLLNGILAVARPVDLSVIASDLSLRGPNCTPPISWAS